MVAATNIKLSPWAVDILGSALVELAGDLAAATVGLQPTQLVSAWGRQICGGSGYALLRLSGVGSRCCSAH